MCFQSAAFASTESVKKENFLTSLISALLNPTPAGKHCSVVLSVPSLPQVPAYRCSVRVAFAISAALGCTHTPAAPGAAPAAASHLQLAELMLWPRESDSAPRSARSTCGNTQPQPQLHCKTLSRRQSRPKLFPEPRFPLLPYQSLHQRRANAFAASTSCIHSCLLAFAAVAYPTVASLPQSGTFLCGLLNSAHPLSSRSASHPE